MGTKTATNSYRALRELSPVQLHAIDLVMEGRTDVTVAAAVGVHRVTVTKWRTRHPAFVAELGRRKSSLLAASSARLSQLVSTALDRVERELVDGPQGAKLAMRIVESTGLLEQSEMKGAQSQSPDDVVEQLMREALPDPFEELADLLTMPAPGDLQKTWDELDAEFNSIPNP